LVNKPGRDGSMKFMNERLAARYFSDCCDRKYSFIEAVEKKNPMKKQRSMVTT
jgi:hypothetical protein